MSGKYFTTKLQLQCFFFFFYFLNFETGSCYVSQAGLDLLILLPQLPEELELKACAVTSGCKQHSLEQSGASKKTFRGIRKYHETNENENTPCQNLWNRAYNNITIRAYSENEGISKINT